MDRSEQPRPTADDVLEVVKRFDALISAGTSVHGHLRAAAIMADTVAGAERAGRMARFRPDGSIAPTGDAADTPRTEQAVEAGRVWLERATPGPLDAVIVDRLAFAVGLLDARNDPATGLSLLIDGDKTMDERAAGLSRLNLQPDTPVRLVATDLGRAASGISAAVPTRYGILQASLDVSGGIAPTGRVGLGEWVRADRAPESWIGAVIAHRLTSSDMITVDVADIGAMLVLARAYDPDQPHPDVETLRHLDARSADVLRALVNAPSIRNAAVELAMHHSTLQAKHDSLTRVLGYDPRTIPGRLRYMTAELLRRLSDG
ncbi:hypothetical protein nbrc107696_21450 [Gordonia spumicola]|uniref:PucR C-terminal helix-turn-helix domain-containing protein n=1 Tax=Gordonia spumicola TaxID=589161 RepID=A0A7I9V8S7_9ACTN|nr:hypothetical protein [Gordonia spumicola]GEE01699.1 hypothetical protein nbrc107696_21450 [Gordonia spumicola]